MTVTIETELFIYCGVCGTDLSNTVEICSRYNRIGEPKALKVIPCSCCTAEIEGELIELRKRVSKLDALESAGVDNWEGYGYAMEEFYADN